MPIRTLVPIADLILGWIGNPAPSVRWVNLSNLIPDTDSRHILTFGSTSGDKYRTSLRNGFQGASFGGATQLRIRIEAGVDFDGATNVQIITKYFINSVERDSFTSSPADSRFLVTEFNQTFSGLFLEQSEINSLDVEFEYTGTNLQAFSEARVYTLNVEVTHTTVSPTEKLIPTFSSTEKLIPTFSSTEKTISRAQFSQSATATEEPIADGTELDWETIVDSFPDPVDHYTTIDEGVATADSTDAVRTLTDGHQDRWRIDPPPSDATLITALGFLKAGSLTIVAATSSYRFEYMINDVVQATFNSVVFSTNQSWTIPGHTDSLTGLTIVPSVGDTHEVRVTFNFTGVIALITIAAFDLVYTYNHLVDTPRVEKTIATSAFTEKTIATISPTEKVI